MLVVNGSDLAAALNKLLRVTPNASEAVIVKALSKEILEIRGFHENRYASFRVKAKAEKSLSFTCSGDRLRGLCNRRGEMTFKRNGRTLSYKEKSYSGQLEISDIETEFPTVDFSRAEGALHDLVKAAVVTMSDELALKDLYENRDNLFFVRIDKGGTTVAGGDRYHPGISYSPTLRTANPLSFSIPSSHLAVVKQNFDLKNDSVNIVKDGGQIHFYNDACTITLPMTVSNSDDATLELIETLFQNTAKQKPLCSGTVDVDALNHVIDNMVALKEKDTALRLALTFKNGLITLQTETRHGSNKDSLEITAHKGSAELTLEASLFQDTLRLIKGSAVFSVFEGNRCHLERHEPKEKRTSRYIVLGLPASTG